MENHVIAIDGPAASGKSTVARRVADALDYRYVDSGAVYRSVAWMALEQGLDPGDAAGVAAMIPHLRIEMVDDHSALRVRINGHLPGEALRTERVNRAVSPVAANPDVRAFVTGCLRRMAATGPLVMEGRDIGTVVFPRAAFKFYLDADPDVRARRRHAEMREAATVDDVEASLARRDRQDRARASAPLAVAEDAVRVDSSALNIDEVVTLVLQTARQQAPLLYSDDRVW